MKARWLALQALWAEVVRWYVLNVVPPGPEPSSPGLVALDPVLVGPMTFEAVRNDPEEVTRGSV